MCKCTPEIRTPFCGKPGCEWPEQRTKETLFDVVAVNIETGAVRVMERGKNAANAEAFIKFAVMRRGVDEEIYKAIPAGSVA